MQYRTIKRFSGFLLVALSAVIFSFDGEPQRRIQTSELFVPGQAIEKSPAYEYFTPNMEMQVPTGEICAGNTLNIPVISRILGMTYASFPQQCGWPHPLGYATLSYEFTYTFNISIIGDSSVSTTPMNLVKTVVVNDNLINVHNSAANPLDLGDGVSIYFDDTDWDCSTDPNCPSSLPDDSIYTNPNYYPTWTECESNNPLRPDITDEWQPNWKFMLQYYLDPAIFTGGAGGSIDFTNSSEYGFSVFSGFGSYLTPEVIPGFCFPCGETATGTVVGGDYYAGTTVTEDLDLTVCPLPLPLKLRRFDLEVMENQAIVLDWAIIKDGLNEQMELEHSADGEAFTTIKSYDVRSLEVNDEFTFTYVDHNPIKGSNYYRLKMTDSDGYIDYSDVEHGYIYNEREEDELLVYPNPVTDQLRAGNLPSSGSAQLFDAKGRLLRELDISGRDLLEIQMTDYPAGVYYLRVESPVAVRSVRFLKQ